MAVRESLEHGETLDYGFLLLAHIICADQQIHSHELQALRDLAREAHISDLTLREVEKVLEKYDTHISLGESVQKVPFDQRSEVLRQILAIAYIDGYFSPLEREVVNQIAQTWGFSEHEIEQMLEYAQGFGRWRIGEHAVDDKSRLSVGAQLLKGAESVLSRSLIIKLAELAPEHIGERIKRLQHEILLSGPEYDEAIQRCAQVAGEDFKYANQALNVTLSSLQDLGNSIQQTIHTIKQKTVGQGEHQKGKDVARQLEQTQQNLSSEILHNLEFLHEALRAKQRSLGYFSIAFMGRTKAGKSTLHAVITREGWDSIGVGKQRTTRYNRVYEWKNIRIIDTPGIGAPGGKTDEEIARSVIEEADVICYVVTNDSIQESEFAFLKVLKDKTKPLIILLNIQYNLRDSRRLEYFLKDPERWFAKEGQSGIAGHLNRIKRYAQQHYASDYLTIIPVMLLAAQLAQEPEFEKHSKQLFKASRIQDFLDSIQASIIDYGAIRRSQTLLGSTVGSINTPYQWITQQATAYDTLAAQLREHCQNLNHRLEKAEEALQEELRQKIKEVFKSASDEVNPFAEEFWEKSEYQMKNGWKEILKKLKFEDRLKAAVESAAQHFQHEVQEAIEEIGNEVKIINQLSSSKFQFSEQDSSFFDFDRDSVRMIGAAIFAVGAILAFLVPPLGGLASIAGSVISFAAGLFKSRDQKRHEAVKNISNSLKRQLEEYQKEILQRSKENFEDYCQSIASAVDDYFEGLIQGTEAIANQLKLHKGKLANAANYLNRAYAKRIVDWATEQPEPLTDITISKKIHKVNRDFGLTFQIETTTALPLTKSQDEICTILQENILIQPTKR
jgi:uncharacterized tellurite resistance protein B-like protein/GTP-binding protein EngB required for normal cell division/predicted Zn-dependent protease with MMP-like domain